MLKAFQSFVRLRPQDKRLLVSSLLLQLGIRTGLWLLPFSRIQRMAGTWGRRTAGQQELPEEEGKRVAWAIAAAGRLVPANTCFVRALAARALLNRRGFSSELRVGIAKGPDGQLKGHAWLEKGGRILVGETENLADYTLLPSLEVNKAQ